MFRFLGSFCVLGNLMVCLEFLQFYLMKRHGGILPRTMQNLLFSGWKLQSKWVAQMWAPEWISELSAVRIGRDVPCRVSSSSSSTRGCLQLRAGNRPSSPLPTLLGQDFPADGKFRKMDWSGRERSWVAAIKLKETTIMCIFSHSWEQWLPFLLQ